ncbi:MAG: O-methyltransferase [Candidatus Dormibacteraeota bacterium]|nr:O-methyltransferase [Candidatus Dormibacteraeota bacterium]
MSEIWTAVDTYLGTLFPDDAVLQAAVERGRTEGLPEIAVSPMQGRLLNILARAMGARAILEVGTLAGYSAIWLGRALPADGRMITLEVDAHHAEVARANLASAGLQNVEVRLGAARTTLPQLIEESAGPFDLIFIDADKVGYPEYFTWSLDLSHAGTLIIADNVVRHGNILDENTDDVSSRAIREFNAMIAADARVDATVLQVVGVKGHDGLAFAVVR